MQSTEDYYNSIPEYYSIDNIDGYYLNAPIEILDIGVREIRLIRRNKISTIRQLVSFTYMNMAKMRYLGRISLECILQALEKMGIYLRRENEDQFLYGYPEYVKEIVKRKDKTWTNMLFLSALIVNLDWMKYYRNYDVYSEYDVRYYSVYLNQRWYVLQLGCINNMDSLMKLIQFVTEKVMEYVDKMANLLKEPLQEALGKDDQPGDEQKIISVVEGLIDCYKDIIHLKQDISWADFDNDFLPVKSKIIAIVDGVIADIDKYYLKLIKARKIIYDIESGNIPEQIPEIDLVLSFSGNNAPELTKIIEEIQERINDKIEVETENDTSDEIVLVEDSENNKSTEQEGESSHFFSDEDKHEIASAIASSIMDSMKNKIEITVKSDNLNVFCMSPYR